MIGKRKHRHSTMPYVVVPASSWTRRASRRSPLKYGHRIRASNVSFKPVLCSVLAYDPTVAAGLHIACAADADYVPHCAALLHSLAVTHDPRDVSVHFLHDRDLEPAWRDRLGAFARELGLRWDPRCVPEDERA